MDIVVEIFGWVGAAAILLGYFLFSVGKIANGYPYQWINLTGAVLLMINAYVGENWPFVILNAVWSVTAVFSLVRLASKARAQAPADSLTSA
ncbi:MAG: CBU_0592 family membrane protein [Microbacteriaceae bacterium]